MPVRTLTQRKLSVFFTFRAAGRLLTADEWDPPRTCFVVLPDRICCVTAAPLAPFAAGRGICACFTGPVRPATLTGAVFAALAARDRAPMPQVLPDFPDVESLAAFLADMRNDLEVPACRTAPVIASVLAALTDQTGCMMARMSGSGATCFGLFRAQADAERAAHFLGIAQPGWWVVAAPILHGVGA